MFPLISSGIYGYPKRQAMQVAVNVINEFLEDHDMTVYLAAFDDETVRLGEELNSSREN